MKGWGEWMNAVRDAATPAETRAAKREAQAPEYNGCYIFILARLLGERCPARPDAGEAVAGE